MIHGVTPLSLSLAGQTLDLFPDGAAWWREQGILILADCHFGKSASFRYHGMAVPEGGTVDDLERIDRLLTRTGARQLLVVGDFFHAPTGYSDEVMAWLMVWRERHAGLRVTLVPGNHDRWLHRWNEYGCGLYHRSRWFYWLCQFAVSCHTVGLYW